MPLHFPPSSGGGGGTPTLGPNLTALESLATLGLVNHLAEGSYQTVPISTFAKTILDDTTASAVRTTLGLVIGTDVQAYNVKLASFSGLTPSSDTLPYFTSSTLMSTTALTSFARTLLDDADASSARTTLGLVIGTDVQGYNAELQAIAGAGSAADRIPYYNGVDSAALTTLTSFGRSLIDDADASAGRTTLGLGTIATQNSNNVSITGGTINGTPVGGTTQSSGKFTDILTNTYIDFTPISAPTHNHGRVWFDIDDDSLSYSPASSAATMNIGKEIWVTSKNSTGSTISNGTPVYINGAVGASGKPTIAKADASLIDKSYLLGVATEDITNGSVGQVTVIGLVRGINTSTYTEGDTLYVSATTPGTFTTTKPSAPNYSIPVARVINVHASNGTIVVLPSTPLLGFGSANQIRAMNGTGTAQEYKNVTGSGNVVLATSPTVSNPTYTGTLTTPLTQNSVAFIGSGGVLTQDTTNFVWDDTNNRLGLGINTPARTLDIVGDIRETRTVTDPTNTTTLSVSDTITMNTNANVHFTSYNLQYNQNTTSTGTVNANRSTVQIGSTSNQNITNVRGVRSTSGTINGATGTITNQVGISAYNTHLAAGLTVTNGYSFQSEFLQGNSAAYTNMAGLALASFHSSPAPTNATYALLGTTTIPTGNWGIYGNYGYNNYLGTGTTLINTTTDSGSGARLQVNGSIQANGQIVATKYSTIFDATTSWGSASGGYYSLTILQTTHKSTVPLIQIFELNGSDYDVIQVDRVRVNSSGDVTIRVPDSPDGRFAGKIVIV